MGHAGVDVWQKTTRFCKAVILQLKNIWGQKESPSSLESFNGPPFCAESKFVSIRSLSSPRSITCAVLCLVAQSCPTPLDPMNCSPPGSSVQWDFPGRNTEVDCNTPLQGICPTQGSNLGLPHCRRIPYQLSCQGSLSSRLPLPIFMLWYNLTSEVIIFQTWIMNFFLPFFLFKILCSSYNLLILRTVFQLLCPLRNPP